MILPKFVNKGLEVAAVCIDASTVAGESVVHGKELKYPMLFDLEGQVFRVYKKNNWVFPLHAIIDRKGNLRALEPELEDAEDAIVKIIDE